MSHSGLNWNKATYESTQIRPLFPPPTTQFGDIHTTLLNINSSIIRGITNESMKKTRGNIIQAATRYL
jgi:hypothetical protein